MPEPAAGDATSARHAALAWRELVMVRLSELDDRDRAAKHLDAVLEASRTLYVMTMVDGFDAWPLTPAPTDLIWYLEGCAEELSERLGSAPSAQLCQVVRLLRDQLPGDVLPNGHLPVDGNSLSRRK